MTKIRVAHFDDNKGDLVSVSAAFKTKNKEFEKSGISAELVQIQFQDHLELCAAINDATSYDLIIIDMYDDKEALQIGVIVLDVIDSQDIKIPTIIYTQAAVKNHRADFEKMNKKYDFLLGEEITKNNLQKLMDKIDSFILDKIIVEDQFMIDEDDIFLKAEIHSIGKKNLNEILYRIKAENSIKDKIQLSKMSSGFSGAAVFRLKFNGKVSILKISRDVEGLREELARAKKYYLLFPAAFRISIDGSEFENGRVLAFLIEEVHLGSPLLSHLFNSEKDVIESLLVDLYFSPNGMKEHYANNRDDEKMKFTKIFEKLSDSKYSFVKKAIEELTPIIDKLSINFDSNDIKNLVVNGGYKKLDKNSLTDSIYFKPLILCHGDFHANNIMVQGNRPVIIDTGGIGYDFWCTDICRLLVNIFISGFDKGTYEYYDLNLIETNYAIGENLINLQEIDLDGKNDGYINGINWIIKNVPEIYGDMFSKWELQLGLCKEFLQSSYRFSSIAPSKRTLALLCALKSIEMANDELSRFSGI